MSAARPALAAARWEPAPALPVRGVQHLLRGWKRRQRRQWTSTVRNVIHNRQLRHHRCVLFIKYPPHSLECVTASDCGTGQYCNLNGDCYGCDVCWAYGDSLTGTCTGVCPVLTVSPTPPRPPCTNHTECGAPTSGLFCTAVGTCLVCRECGATTAIDGGCGTACPPSPPPPPPPCRDEPAGSTGFRVSDGTVTRAATCLDLAQYCEHARLGARVRLACPQTCRTCVDSVNDCCPAVRVQAGASRFDNTDGVYVRRQAVTAGGRNVWEKLGSTNHYIYYSEVAPYWLVYSGYVGLNRGWLSSALSGALCPATPRQGWLEAQSGGGGWDGSTATNVSCCTDCLTISAAHDAGTVTCGQSVSGSTVSGSTIVGFPAPEMWWKFTAPTWGTGEYVISTCGSTFDTYLHVYSRSGQRLGHAVDACDDCGPCNTSAVLTVSLIPGDYWIGIDGYSQASGAYTLSVDCRTAAPTASPTTLAPTAPTSHPSTRNPVAAPTATPTSAPTLRPPTTVPTALPSSVPVVAITPPPSQTPTEQGRAGSAKSDSAGAGASLVPIVVGVVLVVLVVVVIVVVILVKRRPNQPSADRGPQKQKLPPRSRGHIANPVYATQPPGWAIQPAPSNQPTPPANTVDTAA
eukprot:m.233565 g.233565  ORF g.233565 m.233565 type:complete len:631 (-) comp26095_c0_seq1:177-2069(-)